MADVNTVSQYIWRRAHELGVNPYAALGVARYEGLNPNTLGAPTYGNRDAGGYSFGPYQLYSGSPDPSRVAPGGLAYEFQRRYGEAPSRDNWQRQVDYSLETMRDKGFSPWNAVRDQGGMNAITEKGRAFANELGLGPKQAQTPMPQPVVRNDPTALIAMGTNDFTSPNVVGEQTLRAIEAARERGMTPVVVPPNEENSRFRGVGEAARQAAIDAGARIAPTTYGASDPLHLTMDSARNIAARYPNALPIGDSNAVRLGMAMGMTPTNEGKDIVSPQGWLLARTGDRSAPIVDRMMGLPFQGAQPPQMANYEGPQLGMPPTMPGGLLSMPDIAQPAPAQAPAPVIADAAPAADSGGLGGLGSLFSGIAGLLGGGAGGGGAAAPAPTPAPEPAPQPVQTAEAPAAEAPKPILSATSTEGANDAPVYGNDVGTGLRRFGNWLAPDLVDPAKPLSPKEIAEQKAQQERLAALSKAQQGFGAITALGKPQQQPEPQMPSAQMRPVNFAPLKRFSTLRQTRGLLG